MINTLTYLAKTTLQLSTRPRLSVWCVMMLWIFLGLSSTVERAWQAACQGYSFANPKQCETGREGSSMCYCRLQDALITW